MKFKLNLFNNWVRQMARLMVGMPDYDNYVALRTASHPGEPVMTYKEFFEERQKARYGGRQCTTRCC